MPIYNVLGQINPTPNVLTSIFTVPLKTAAVVNSVVVCNQSNVDTRFSLAVRILGATITSNSYIYYNTLIPANDSISTSIGMTLSAYDVLCANTISPNVSISAFGSTEYAPTPPPSSIEYLVVAGGGSGGAGATAALGGGGGGGAGGVLAGTGFAAFSGSTIGVTVGAGGAWAGYRTASTGNNGSNSNVYSSVSVLTAIGGGGGAGILSGTTAPYGVNPNTGGSGGGGAGTVSTGSAGTGAAGTSSQGNSGGNRGGTGNYVGGGGGGGAGGAGGDGYQSSSAASGVGGTGGAGIQSSITGIPTYYGGGGGAGPYGGSSSSGGFGGVGGGGRGAITYTYGTDATVEQPGTINTGGGGGGACYSGNQAQTITPNGGSGIVVLRHPLAYSPAISTTGNPLIYTIGSNVVYVFTSSGTITF